MYIEILKNDHITVKKTNKPILDRPKEALIKAKIVIKNPSTVKVATFLMGSEISIIILAKRVTTIIAFIPLLNPKNLPIKPAIAIKIIALTASPH
jgi:hypothetical protein